MALRFACDSCDWSFQYKDDFEDHLNDYQHWLECETCSRSFHTDKARAQHMNAVDHWGPRYGRETCTNQYLSESARNVHMNRENHYWDRYCQDCDRYFQNPNNLRAHLNSRIHRGRSLACPFCKNTFVAASGLAHHLETGSCPNAPSLNHEKVFRIVRELDPHGAISKKLLTWPGDSDAKFEVTDRAYNGSGWECYLCHREFGSPHGLTQHINSPVHRQKVYHCPNRQCGREVVSLAALCNHLESESCGSMRFEKVQQQFGDMITSRRMITC